MSDNGARGNGRLYGELFARVPIGLYQTTPDGRIVDVNPALVHMLGYPDREALLAEDAGCVYARPEARERWTAEMDARGTVSGFEAEWRCRDGTQIWVEENAHAVRASDGTILHYNGSAQDVTERHRAQEELSAEKARFEQLFAAAPEAIVVCDDRSVIQRANSEFTKLFGYAESEAAGRRIDELVAGGIPGLAEEARRVTDDIAAGKTAYVETRRRRKDGTLVHVSVLGKPVFTGDTRIAHYAIYRDITVRVEMEAKLAEEKARFEQLFAAAPEAIVLCANDGRVLRVNDAFSTLFGYSAGETVGANIDRLITPGGDGLEDEARGITQRIADGQLSFVETRRQRKDGRLVHVSILAKPILIGGDQVALYGISRDITAQKGAEAALAESHRKVIDLHEAADGLAGAEKEEDIYHITCEAAERVLGFSLAVLCIADGDEFVCQAVSSKIGIESLGRTRIDPEGAAMHALKEARPIIARDPHPATLPLGIPATCRSLLCAPIGTLGILQAASPSPDAFSEDDGRLLAILLGHTAVAVERLQLQKELIRQARHDALTGVFNRQYFNEFIAQEVLRATRYDHPIGLLMIDVNRFKEINDRHGHQTGDIVLREIATVLTETVRKTDMVVRYGGDEFLVVLTETGHEAEDAARRVRAAVRASEKLREISGFDVTVSVGHIFWHPDTGTPIEQALATADARMYDDKRGR
jgi:diguanylate cyclase (GGDEF)-like protein/PAS domain S-box-containing protein